MCDEDKTSNSVQACSDLAHVVLVLVGVRRVRRVRRVTVVHIGLESVLVVIHFCAAILFVNCCIRRCSLYISFHFSSFFLLAFLFILFSLFFGVGTKK